MDSNTEIVVADDARGESTLPSGLAQSPPPPSRANAPSTVDDDLPDLTFFAAGDITFTEILPCSPADPLVTLTSETPTAPLCHPSSLALQYPDFSAPFPRYCSPTSKSDTELLAMVTEARGEHLHGRFNVSQPSLQRLLSGAPTDTLSFRLFNWLREYGPMPLHLLLGVFWTQYLVLRVSREYNQRIRSQSQQYITVACPSNTGIL